MNENSNNNEIDSLNNDSIDDFESMNLNRNVLRGIFSYGYESSQFNQVFQHY